MAFRRRHRPGHGMGAMLATVAASAIPSLAIAVGLGSIAVIAGLAADDMASALRALGWGVPVLIASLVTHEFAHLAVMRGVLRDRLAGAVAHSWLNVWVVGPVLASTPSRVVATAGPLAGAAMAAAMASAGGPRWIAWLVGTAHLVNLAPGFPDGRALWGRSG